MRLGVYGGTFNPPHNGHLMTARRAVELLGLDKMIIMPSFTPPHKQGHQLATPKDRLRMCQLMFSEDIFEVSELEISRGGKSYTVDTLRELRKMYPEAEIYLIVGSDMLLSFDKWYRWQDILSMCRLCAFSREDEVSPKTLISYAAEVLCEKDIVVSTLPAIELSSTKVRENIESGRSIEGCTVSEVADYIEKNKVYVPDTDRAEEFRALAEKMLKPERYEHVLGVAGCAKELALIYGENPERAYCTGLLHDITKHFSPEEHIKTVEEAGMSLSDAEMANSNLWHGVSAAAYMKTKLNIKDAEMISAVRYHTTGKAGMSLLEKIVYIADFISPERRYPDVEVMREKSKQSLDGAALYALRFCIARLIKENKVIHTDSVGYYNELIIKEENTDDRT